MEGAIQNNIPGIDADYGGGMVCSNMPCLCPRRVVNKLPKAEDAEQDMIDMALSQ